MYNNNNNNNNYIGIVVQTAEFGSPMKQELKLTSFMQIVIDYHMKPPLTVPLPQQKLA
jgi:hypothetical protein